MNSQGAGEMIASVEQPAHPAATGRAAIVPAFARLRDVPATEWQALADASCEENGYFLPGWLQAVDASARSRADNDALLARMPDGALAGLLPVVSLRRAYSIPLPALVSADPYATLTTPLISKRNPAFAVEALLEAARESGARALILRDMALDGVVMDSFTRVATAHGLQIHVLDQHRRACLDATQDGEAALREALGPKKLKELRRQRNRLADIGEVQFSVARQPDDVARATEVFLELEASGWKAKRGTALKQHDGDAAFIRRATTALAAQGRCDIAMLKAGSHPVAAGVLVRHRQHAFYFKMGVDETYAKLSPGVQLTCDITRHLCSDPDIVFADSSAAPNHPMIDPIWRERRAIGDVFISLRAGDAIARIILETIRARRRIREPLRNFVHYLRKHQEKTV